MKKILISLLLLVTPVAMAASVPKTKNRSTDGDLRLQVYPGGVQTDAIHLEGTNAYAGFGASSPVARVHIRGSGTSGQVTGALILENFSSGTAGWDITGSAGSSRLRFMYGGGPGSGTNSLSEAMSIMLEGATTAGDILMGGISATPMAGVDLQIERNDATAKGPTLFLRSAYAAGGTKAAILLGVDSASTVFSNDVIKIEAGDAGVFSISRGDDGSGYINRMSFNSNGTTSLGGPEASGLSKAVAFGTSTNSPSLYGSTVAASQSCTTTCNTEPTDLSTISGTCVIAWDSSNSPIACGTAGANNRCLCAGVRTSL